MVMFEEIFHLYVFILLYKPHLEKQQNIEYKFIYSHNYKLNTTFLNKANCVRFTDTTTHGVVTSACTIY